MSNKNHVEYFFDLQNVKDENVVELFKNRFGKIIEESQLHYEIYELFDEDEFDEDDENNEGAEDIGDGTIQKMVGGNSETSTFPYNKFESMMETLSKWKDGINAERTSAFDSLFKPIKKNDTPPLANQPPAENNILTRSFGYLTEAVTKKNVPIIEPLEKKEDKPANTSMLARGFDSIVDTFTQKQEPMKEMTTEPLEKKETAEEKPANTSIVSRSFDYIADALTPKKEHTEESAEEENKHTEESVEEPVDEQEKEHAEESVEEPVTPEPEKEPENEHVEEHVDEQEKEPVNEKEKEPVDEQIIPIEKKKEEITKGKGVTRIKLVIEREMNLDFLKKGK